MENELPALRGVDDPKPPVCEEFRGMSDRESVDHQVREWVKGNPLHNTVRDECCPDFSCCQRSMLMSKAGRERFAEAHFSGDSDTVDSMLMMVLAGAVSDISEVKVHISGEDQAEH